MQQVKENDWRLARILTIDDEPLINRSVSANLRRGGFQCVEGITDPLEAIKTLDLYRPALILLDIHMPGLNGIELLREIKSTPRFASIIVVMLSSATEEARWESLELGAIDFIHKPINGEELFLRVRNALKNAYDPVGSSS